MTTLPEGEPNGRFLRWRRGAIATLAAIAGLTTLAAQISTRAPSALAHGPAIGGVPALALHALGVAGGAGLLFLARGLWRGKRRAADLAIGALLLIAAGRAALGLGPLDVGIDLLFAAVLVANRGALQRANAPVSRDVAVSGTIALAAAAGLYAAYALTILATTHSTDTDQAIALAGRELLRGGGWVSASWWVRLIFDALVATTIVAGAAFLHGLLRPARRSDGHSPQEHSRALEIVQEHGADSLDPFALREDKALHFAAGGFLSYRVLGETAVVSGDPIGREGATASILASFMHFARQRGWDVVVTGASDRHLEAARGLGLRALCIGQEAVVDPADFSLEGRAIRKVRQSVTRVARHGWTVETVEGNALTPELAAELEQVESTWRASQPRLIGFAMTLGRLAGTEEDDGALYVLGRDPAGRLRSFLRFAPFRDGISLDLMRRLGDEPNGLTEAQVVAAIEYAKAQGMRGVSLNFAGFAHLMAADAALSRSQRLLRGLLRAMHGRFQLERLIRFNAKFFPAWQSRYLLYGRPTHLPLAALRVLQAEAYLPGPGGQRMAGRWEARPSAVAVGGKRSAGWRRWTVAAAILLTALVVPTELLIVRAGAAKPLHVGVRRDRSSWAFTYAQPGIHSTSSRLYLPQGRPVTLRFAIRDALDGSSGTQASDRSVPTIRTLRLRASRPGLLPVPCAGSVPNKRCVIKADVLGRRAFWSRVARQPPNAVPGQSPAPGTEQPDVKASPGAA